MIIIFRENIKNNANIKIKNLYKDLIQRDQFKPFIDIIKRFCKEHELVVNQDYRESGISKLERLLYPINDQTFFQVSSIFSALCFSNRNKPNKPSLPLMMYY